MNRGRTAANIGHCLRLVDRHTPRVTGAKYYAALGLGINKIGILARHSGDTILRYVQEAPLDSIRADLDISSRAKRSSSDTGFSTGTSVHVERIQSIESMMSELHRSSQAQALDISASIAATSSSVVVGHIPNCSTARVHLASTSNLGRTRCGWCYDGPTHSARRRVASGSFRVISSLYGLPGETICDRCLPWRKQQPSIKISSTMS